MSKNIRELINLSGNVLHSGDYENKLKPMVPNAVLKALIELDEQIGIVEPHADSDADLIAHHKACRLINAINLWASGECTIKIITNVLSETDN